MSHKDIKTPFSISRRTAFKGAGALGAAVAAGGLGTLGAQDATPGASPAAAPTTYEPQGPQVEKLTFWTRSSIDSSANEWNALVAATERYTEITGTPVELMTVVDADFRNNLSLAAPSGDGPDAFGPVAHDWLGELALQEIALATNELVGLEDVAQPTIDAVTYEGDVYGYPLFSESLLLFRNTDLVPEAPTTWDELVQMATEITEGDTWGFTFPVLEQYYEGAFFHAAGSYIFKNNDGTLDYTDIGLNNEGGVEAAKWLRDMFNNQTPPMPEDMIDRPNAGGFVDSLQEAGLLGMTIAGPWREPAVRDAGINYEFSKLPTAPNGEPLQPFSGIQVVCANAFGEQQEAALDLVNFLGSIEGVSLMFEGFNKAPVHGSMRDQAVEASPTLAVVMEQVEDAVPMPNIPQMAQVWSPWGDAMDGIIMGNVSDEEVQQLLDDAVAQIEANIANN
jgi:maltose-binding protein MalE